MMKAVLVRPTSPALTLGELRRALAGYSDDLGVVVRFHVGEDEQYEEGDIACGVIESARQSTAGSVVIDCSSSCRSRRKR